MTQIKRRLGDYAASVFLNSQDIIGNEGPAVITGVAEREVQDEKKPGGKRLAIMLTFDRWPDKGYDCNSTNIRVLQDMLGEDVTPDDLRGVRVFLTTHQTNFGRGILFQPPQDSMHDASAAARQRIADARAREAASVDQRYAQAPPTTLRLQHSHEANVACDAATCDVARAISLGHPVDELWPVAEDVAPQSSAGFVPQHQPNASEPGRIVGTGPQARREPPSGPASTTPQERFANERIAPPSDEDIPF